MQGKAAWCLNKGHEVQSVSQCSVPRCVPGIYLQEQNMEKMTQNSSVKWSCWRKGSSWSASLILSISKEGKSKISQGNPFLELFPTTVKMFFYDQVEFPLFQIVSFASCPFAGHHWGILNSIFQSQPPPGIFTHGQDPPGLSLLQSQLSQPLLAHQMLQAHPSAPKEQVCSPIQSNF